MSYDTAMEMKRIRHLTGLSQEKFGRKYGIPKRTIQNWELGLNEPAPYLIELLEFKVKTDVEHDVWCNLRSDVGEVRDETKHNI